jgi:phosphoribosylglycinamide formyltransferase-1
MKSKEGRSADVKHRLAIFASGAGSNAARIMEHFRASNIADVVLVVCNKPGAGVLEIAKREGVPSILIEKERFFRGDAFLSELQEAHVSFLILAGFLWKIPEVLINAFPRKIVNIHPALLPAYGGKGMYGSFVHSAVIGAKEQRSGITIHYVDGHYDNGDIIFQKDCPVLPDDTVESLAEKIHQLEHEHFAPEIEKLLKMNV